jgi:hypothetical protein
MGDIQVECAVSTDFTLSDRPDPAGSPWYTVQSLEASPAREFALALGPQTTEVTMRMSAAHVTATRPVAMGVQERDSRAMLES